MEDIMRMYLSVYNDLGKYNAKEYAKDFCRAIKLSGYTIVKSAGLDDYNF